MSLVVQLTDDLAACHMLRRKVFIDEQNVTEEEEMDDLDGVCDHLLALLDGQAVGSARLMVKDGKGKVGRVCVLAEARGRHVGVALMKAAIAHFRAMPGIAQVTLSAQTHALGFYGALGFEAHGPEYLDADIPHRDMTLTL